LCWHERSEQSNPALAIASTVSNYNMKKIGILLLTTFLFTSIYGQKLESRYECNKLSTNFFKKIKYRISGHEVYSYRHKIELFNDNSFESTEFSTEGIYVSYYKQGLWKIENDTLILSTSRIKLEKEDIWKTDEWKETFLITDKALIPIIKGDLDKKRKLKKE